MTLELRFVYGLGDHARRDEAARQTSDNERKNSAKATPDYDDRSPIDSATPHGHELHSRVTLNVAEHVHVKVHLYWFPPHPGVTVKVHSLESYPAGDMLLFLAQACASSPGHKLHPKLAFPYAVTSAPFALWKADAYPSLLGVLDPEQYVPDDRMTPL
jgi:hypothetical protein